MDETLKETQGGGAEEHRPGFLRRGSGTVEHLLEDTYDNVSSRLRKRPVLGVALAGGATLVLASAIGVGEVAVGALAGYAVWKMLGKKKRQETIPEDKATT